MNDKFYLQDSRSHVGDGMSFWAKEGKGYYTDLDKCELYTKEQACRHRDTDIPWPKDYIDARSHLGVDCQLLSLDDAAAHFEPGCICLIQVPGKWNGNDIFFARWPIGSTDHLERAHRMTLEAAKAIGDDELIIWPLDYIESKARRLIHLQAVDLKQALRGTGIKFIKPKNPRNPLINCHGCGRFITEIQIYQEDCRNCGADNMP